LSHHSFPIVKENQALLAWEEDAVAKSRSRVRIVRSKKKTAPKSRAGKRKAAPKRSGGARRSKLGNGHGVGGDTDIAQRMAAEQRAISVSEFFLKNRHLLGFDSPRKALLTAVKEAVDNALDACEEAGVLPDLAVEVRPVKGTDDRFTVAVTDNGPGIVKKQIPMIFGKLLYGSKFHRLRQSRGQQGIGISAAGMYGQLTSGKPVRITSRTSARKPAHYYEITIDTAKNQPRVVRDDEVDWKHPRGTRVEIEMEASYKRGRLSVDEYLLQTAIANPHARIVYQPPSGAAVDFPRATKDLPREPREIKPHPYGIELGALIRMLQGTKSRTLAGFLHSDFSRVSSRVAKEICTKAKLYPNARPRRIASQEAEKLFRAIGTTKIMAPPTDCLSPIGEEALIKGLRKEVEAEFYTAVTRPPSVYRGNPFCVEVAVAYGGEVKPDGLVRVLRFANRVPLLYQPGSCSIHASMLDTNWRPYGLDQSRGALPSGPAVVAVHFASAWVPFTSESKEAIAHYPEIVKDIRLALQECGRRLAVFVKRRRRAADEARKKSYIEKYLPHIGIGLREIMGFSGAEEKRTVRRLKTILEKSRKG